MHREKVASIIRCFLADGDPDTKSAIQYTTDLFDLEIFDSLKIVSLVVFIEEKFGLSLDFDDLTEENLGSLEAITDLILQKST